MCVHLAALEDLCFFVWRHLTHGCCDMRVPGQEGLPQVRVTVDGKVKVRRGTVTHRLQEVNPPTTGCLALCCTPGSIRFLWEWCPVTAELLSVEVKEQKY